jgi:long-chain acyl-CoA synthetase
MQNMEEHDERDATAQITGEGEDLLDTRPWVKHYEQGVPTHLDIPDRPLTWLLDHTAERYPDHIAFIYLGTKLTYAQFARYANRFASSLQRLGVKKGNRVAIALPNVPQYPIAFYGALKAGAIVVPTNPLYTEREMQYQLADSGARLLVMLDSFYPVVRAVRNQTALEHIIITSPADFLPRMLRLLYPLSQRGATYPEPPLTSRELHADQTLHLMHPMLESHSSSISSTSPVAVSAEDLAVIQYTGGTTGLPKGAMLTHRNLLANAMQGRAWIPRAREKR